MPGVVRPTPQASLGLSRSTPQWSVLKTNSPSFTGINHFESDRPGLFRPKTEPPFKGLRDEELISSVWEAGGSCFVQRPFSGGSGKWIAVLSKHPGLDLTCKVTLLFPTSPQILRPSWTPSSMSLASGSSLKPIEFQGQGSLRWVPGQRYPGHWISTLEK